MNAILEILAFVLMIPTVFFMMKFTIDIANGRHKKDPRVIGFAFACVLLLYLLIKIGVKFVP